MHIARLAEILFKKVHALQRYLRKATRGHFDPHSDLSDHLRVKFRYVFAPKRAIQEDIVINEPFRLIKKARRRYNGSRNKADFQQLAS